MQLAIIDQSVQSGTQSLKNTAQQFVTCDHKVDCAEQSMLGRVVQIESCTAKPVNILITRQDKQRS